ncbi:histidine acid phosphatase domain protein [Escherichia coli 1-182-04_S3_C2]|nr:histidine acid phosphatase domain protein [Escherichia coli 1-182-04_S3_C3]EZJ87862.1 histidine acid phosphatase domain protein [Escherichia coli 1-182-04_S3_C2]EZK02168.1 histidine acid phosphatase domain protein [Escherichia coli 1-182-04_S3_C1]
MQLLDIVSLILFCGNEKQQPVTTSTSLNMQSPMQAKEGANKQVISSQADSLIKISRIWADFFPANTSNQSI